MVSEVRDKGMHLPAFSQPLHSIAARGNLKSSLLGRKLTFSSKCGSVAPAICIEEKLTWKLLLSLSFIILTKFVKKNQHLQMLINIIRFSMKNITMLSFVNNDICSYKLGHG
jgi:hypothetical protein